MFDDFVQVLMEPDLLVLMDVYPAGEAPLTAFDSKALLQSLRLLGRKDSVHVEDRQQLDEVMPNLLLEDDVVLVMGAGDIGQISKDWKEQGV